MSIQILANFSPDVFFAQYGFAKYDQSLNKNNKKSLDFYNPIFFVKKVRKQDKIQGPGSDRVGYVAKILIFLIRNAFD